MDRHQLANDGNLHLILYNLNKERIGILDFRVGVHVDFQRIRAGVFHTACQLPPLLVIYR